MKTLWQTLLSLLISIALVVVGFYMGTQSALIAEGAARIGLDRLLPDSFAAIDGDAATSARMQMANRGAFPGQNSGNLPGGATGIANMTATNDLQTVAVQATSAASSSVNAVGTIATATELPVVIPLEGTVAQVAVAAGDTVAAGDLLLALDAAELEAAVKNALATLDAAETALATINAVETEPNMMTTNEKTAQQRVEQAQAAVEAAAASLAASQITAPADGTVTSVEVAVGQSVESGQEAVLLTGADALQLTTDVPATVAAQLHVGDPVTVTVTDLAGTTLAGAVSAVVESGTAGSVPVTVQLAADNQSVVQAGMLATVTFTVAGDGAATDAAAGDTWLVPATAVQDRNGETVVLVLSGGIPNPITVTLLEPQGDQIVVQSSQLQMGDEVIADATAMGQGSATPGNLASGSDAPGASTAPDANE